MKIHLLDAGTTFPMTIKPSWSNVKPINLLCFSSGVASGPEKSWKQNKMSGIWSAQKVKTLDISYSDREKRFLYYFCLCDSLFTSGVVQDGGAMGLWVREKEEALFTAHIQL